MQRRVCFSSFEAMVLKIVGHDMSSVGVCQHFRDCNKKNIINSASYVVRISPIL